MIYSGSKIVISDNSGVMRCQIFGPGRNMKGRTARLGDVVTGSVRDSKNSSLRDHAIVKILVIRTCVFSARPSGSRYKYDENAGIIWDVSKNSPFGSRVTGPVSRDIRKLDGGSKVLAMSDLII